MADEIEKAKIHVVGKGQVSVAPDMAVVTMGVTREAKTAREALSANTEAMAAVLSSMQKAGIAERDLQTSNFSIQPRYDYKKRSSSGQQEQPIILGYIVRNTLTVRIRDLEAVGDVLDASVSLGVNDGGNLQFTNDDPTDAINQARTKAMKDAIAKAKTLTDAAEVKLGNILEITEGNAGGGPVPIARARTMEMSAASAPVPVAAGENTYTISVNVTFELDQ